MNGVGQPDESGFVKVSLRPEAAGFTWSMAAVVWEKDRFLRLPIIRLEWCIGNGGPRKQPFPGRFGRAKPVGELQASLPKGEFDI